jgi:tetratricopeptide (TPR) repeat protein
MKRISTLLAVCGIVAATAVPALAHPIHHFHHYPVHPRPVIVVGAPVVAPVCVVDYMFYIRQGDALNSQGNYDAAIASYTQAIARDPNRPLGFVRRAAAWTAKGNLDRAVADNTQASAIMQSVAR